MPDPDWIRLAKENAAATCVENEVKSGQVVGIGTGTTVKCVVEQLSNGLRSGLLQDIVCVPTSFQARHLIIDSGLVLSDIECTPVSDICIDGADELDDALNCIKGSGACLTQAKIVQSWAERWVIVADHRKRTPLLGQRMTQLPLEVVPAAYVPMRRWVQEQEGGTCHMRMATNKAGPVITDNGNYILDWDFPKGLYVTAKDWQNLHERLKVFAGMVETGLFIGACQCAYIGMPDGSVQVQTAGN